MTVMTCPTAVAELHFLETPFDLHGRHTHEVHGGQTLAEAICAHWPENWPDDAPPALTLVVNGEQVTDVDRVILAGDQVSVFPTMGEPISIGVAVAAAIGTTGVVAVVVTAVVALAVIAAVGYGISALTAQDPPDFNTGDEGSNTYRWDGIKTQYRGLGSPMPVLYGEHDTGGVVISYVVRTKAGRSFLRVLLVISHGPIQSIAGFTEDQDGVSALALLSDEALTLNGVPARSYGNKCRISIRLGKRGGRILRGFNDQEQTYPFQQQLITNRLVEYVTRRAVNGVQLNAQAPGGLVSVSNTGHRLQRTVVTQVRFRTDTPGSEWSDWDRWELEARTTDPYPESHYFEFPALGNYRVQIRRRTATSASIQIKDRIDLVSVTEVIERDFLYPGMALLALDLKAVEGLSGGKPSIRVGAEGRLVPVWDGVSESNPNFVDTYTANNFWCALDALRNTTYGMGRAMSLMSFDPQDWKDGADHADEYVNAGNSSITTAVPFTGAVDLLVADETQFRVNDLVAVALGGAFEQVGIVRDINASKLRLSSPLSAHVRGTTVERVRTRYSFNGIQDEGGSAWEVVQGILAPARAIAVKFGNEIILVRSVTRSPVMLVNEGNVSDFRLTYLSPRSQPNAIALSFWDKDQGYERNSVEARATDVITDNVTPSTYYSRDELSTKNMTVKGINSIEFAESHAAWILKSMRLPTRGFSFGMSLEALAARVGRVIAITHRTVLAAVGGRVRGAQLTGSSIIALDRPVVLAGGTTYAIRVRLGDDTLAVKTITSGAGSYARDATLSIAPATWGDDVDDKSPYAIGIEDQETVPAEIVGFALRQDLQVELQCMEYVEAVNDAST